MKDLYYIGGACLVAILLGTVLYFFDPSSVNHFEEQSLASPAAPINVPFTILGQGTKAISITDRTNYRITNASDLQSLWQLVYGANDLPPVPNVDFTTYEVLGVFDGTHATNGYSIKVQSIVDAESMRKVMIEHFTPDSTCTLSYTQTSPFEIIQVPISTLELTHVDMAGTSTCQ
jgi:hypothetical protein